MMEVFHRQSARFVCIYKDSTRALHHIEIGYTYIRVHTQQKWRSKIRCSDSMYSEFWKNGALVEITSPLRTTGTVHSRGIGYRWYEMLFLCLGWCYANQYAQKRECTEPPTVANWFVVVWDVNMKWDPPCRKNYSLKCLEIQSSSTTYRLAYLSCWLCFSFHTKKDHTSFLFYYNSFI